MSTQVLEQHIVMTPGILGGRPRIAGHRISVYHVYEWHDIMGMSVDQIARDYVLTPGQIYAALSYYWDNKAEIDRQEAEDRAFVEEYFKNNPSPFPELHNERED